MKTYRILTFITLTALGSPLLHAAPEPRPEPPKNYRRGGYFEDRERVHPLLDQPLRDGFIVKGPDNVYYLTGTPGSRTTEDGGRQSDSTKLPPSQSYGEASATKSPSNQAPDTRLPSVAKRAKEDPSPPRNKSKDQALDTRHSVPDFNNTPGIRIWKSEDGKTWQDLGLVWKLTDLPEDAWQRAPRANPDATGGPAVNGVTAPEIHFLDGTVYLAYSINGQGTGLLRGNSGKVEGPYEDIGRITARFGDPSLFRDHDGTTYWICGNGLFARLKDDLSGLAEPLRPFHLDALKYFKTVRAFGHTTGDHTINGGFGVIRTEDAKGKPVYNLTFRNQATRRGRLVNDLMAAGAPAFAGPYDMAHVEEVSLHAGQANVFRDGDGFTASFTGYGPLAVFRDRPGMTPLNFNDREGRFSDIQYNYFTEAGPWVEDEPFLKDVQVNDQQVIHAPDGYYYFTGSTWDNFRKGQFNLWRSKDLETWEELPSPYTQEQAMADPGISDQTKEGWYLGQFWNPEIHYLKGHYWLYFDPPSKTRSGGILLRSTSGRATGPYAAFGEGYGSASTLFEDDDPPASGRSGEAGSTVYVSVGAGPIWRLNDDMTLASDGQLPARTRENLIIDIDIGSTLVKIGGKYVLFHCNVVGGYGWQYYVADHIEGPWSRPRVAVPHGGHGFTFKDKQGQWQGLYWTYAWHMRPGLQKLDVEVTDDDVIISPSWWKDRGLEQAPSRIPAAP